MSDLIERLHAAQLRGNTPPREMHLLEEAVERIKELMAEVERYKRVVPGKIHSESEWTALLSRAEAAEVEVAWYRDALFPPPLAPSGPPNLEE